MDDDRTHKPMTRRQRLAGRQGGSAAQYPPQQERTAVDAVKIVLGLLLMVFFTMVGIVSLNRLPETGGRVALVCLQFVLIGLALVLAGLRKRKRRD